MSWEAEILTFRRQVADALDRKTASRSSGLWHRAGLHRHAEILVLAQTDGEAESDEEPARNL